MIAAALTDIPGASAAVYGGYVTYANAAKSRMIHVQARLIHDYGAVSNQRAIAAGLTFRPLAETVTDLLAWYRSQTPERQAEVRAGIAREKEAELLKAWHAQS